MNDTGFIWISSTPYQGLVNALSSVSNGWIQRLDDSSDVQNLSHWINRMASHNKTGRSHKAWGKAPGWCPRMGTVRKWTPSVWRETTQLLPLSVLSPATVATKTSLQADSEPLCTGRKNLYLCFSSYTVELGWAIARRRAGPPERGPWPRGPLVPWSPSH